MIPELGHFALILALSLTIMQSVMPLIGAARGNKELMDIAVPTAHGQFLFTLIAFVALRSIPGR